MLAKSYPIRTQASVFNLISVINLYNSGSYLSRVFGWYENSLCPSARGEEPNIAYVPYTATPVLDNTADP